MSGYLSEFADSEISKHLQLAVNNAYSALPDSLLIESTATPTKLHSTQQNAAISNQTVIYVTRTDSSSKRKCIWKKFFVYEILFLFKDS